MKKLLILGVCVFGMAACSGDDDTSSTPSGGNGSNGGGTAEESIVIGAVFHDDVSDSAKSRLQAIELAVSEINDSGVFDKSVEVVNLRPTDGDSASAEKAAERARELYDDYDAVGVISLFSSLGRAIIGVTNDADYDFVQCNVSASNPYLNDSTSNTAEEPTDVEDNFYRTVASDFLQGGEMVNIVQNEGWTKVGIYYVDDAFGNGLKGVLTDGLGDVVSSSHVVAFASGEYDVASEAANLDSMISGGLDAIILPTLKESSPFIVDYLTSNNFSGTILLSDGAKTDDIFTAADSLETWLGVEGNAMVGTEPNNFAGANSAVFTTAFEAEFSEEPNTYSPTAYDCAMAFAHAMLKAGGTDRASIQSGLQSFKESNRGTNETRVGIGSSGLSAASAAYAAGESVSYEGASGRIIFDDTGDRLELGIRTFSPSLTDGSWAWSY